MQNHVVRDVNCRVKRAVFAKPKNFGDRLLRMPSGHDKSIIWYFGVVESLQVRNVHRIIPPTAIVTPSQLCTDSRIQRAIC